MAAARLQKLGEQTFARLEKVNSELFTLTYGSFVAQLIEDYEDIDAVNQQLERIGFRLGQRLIDEYFSKSGADPCRSFNETAEHIAKVGFRMFLGVTARVTNWLKNKKSEFVSFCLVLPENPLLDFVELPEDIRQELIYSNILCGVIRGCLEMVQLRVECEITKCPLRDPAEAVTEMRVTLKEVLVERVREDD